MAQMGGQTAFQQALAREGWTLSSYRDFLRVQARQQRLYGMYMQQRSRELASIVVDEEEIREFFEEQREAIGNRPPGVKFAQIIITPIPSDSVVEAARAEAERIRQLVLGGEDFGELAAQYSVDPGSKDNGGDLGWFRRGTMVPTFDEAVFNLAVNEVSEPVESPFGFHIIRLDRRRSGEVRASHILIPVDVSGEETENQALETAQQVKSRLEAGDDFETLREAFGNTEEPDTLSVALNQLSELPPGFAEPLLQADAGQVLDPIRYETAGLVNFSVIMVLERIEGGEATLEDEALRAQIIDAIQQQKLVERILEELRASTYVQIRM
jgi:parvulin-like peptidyl-prolyl isomerase